MNGEDCQRVRDRIDAIVGVSCWANGMRAGVLRVARHDTNVLVSGPSGTGKELVARAIHTHSCRALAPFVPVDCAALPSELFVSQMFGHVKGAFTGRTQQRSARFVPQQVARSSSTKSVNSNRRCKRNCCGSFRKGLSFPWAAR